MQRTAVPLCITQWADSGSQNLFRISEINFENSGEVSIASDLKTDSVSLQKPVKP